MGRGPHLTEESKRRAFGRIVEALRKGATVGIASQYAGISETTAYQWRARGRAGDPFYRKFAEDWDEAVSRGAIELLENVRVAGDDGDWRAAAWLLERRHPSQYGKQVVEHAIAKEPAVDPDAIEAEIRALLAEMGDE